MIGRDDIAGALEVIAACTLYAATVPSAYRPLLVIVAFAASSIAAAYKWPVPPPPAAPPAEPLLPLVMHEAVLSSEPTLRDLLAVMDTVRAWKAATPAEPPAPPA